VQQLPQGERKVPTKACSAVLADILADWTLQSICEHCVAAGRSKSASSSVRRPVVDLHAEQQQKRSHGHGLNSEVVVEQRATNFLIHVLIGCALFMAPILKFIPRAVLQGVFFYMGIASLTGNNLFDRMKLWLIWDSSKYPSYHYIQKLPVSRVHLYTFVQ
ncbi:SLC4A4, partial [Symbiodinium sp. CCMP2456]